MNKETCCTHCDGGCAEWVGHVIHGPDGKILAVWASGHCPACDEAEHIAAKCIEWAEGCYQRGEDDAVRELNEMADFARGDR